MGTRLEATVAAVVALGAAAGVGIWQHGLDKVYSASSLLAVSPAPATVASAGTRPDNAVFLSRSYAAWLDARPALAEAAKRSRLPLTVDQTRRRAAVSVSTTDATITVTATGPSRAAAQALDQALTDTLVMRVRAEQQTLRNDRLAPVTAEIGALQAQIGRTRAGSAERVALEQQFRALLATRAQIAVAPLDQVDVLSPAAAASAPVFPHPTRTALLAFLVAAAVLAQVVVWRRSRRARLVPYPVTSTDAALAGPPTVAPTPAAGATAPARAPNGRYTRKVTTADVGSTHARRRRPSSDGPA